MIEGAAQAGASAFKFQTFKANKLVLEKEDHFRIIQNAEHFFDDYKELSEIARLKQRKLHLSRQKKLSQICNECHHGAKKSRLI